MAGHCRSGDVHVAIARSSVLTNPNADSVSCGPEEALKTVPFESGVRLECCFSICSKNRAGNGVYLIDP